MCRASRWTWKIPGHALAVRGTAVALLCLLAGQAQATYRADFFDTTKRPTITFDKGKTTWTLRNQGVERVVHYDAKTGGLETIALRDLKTHHVLKQAPGGEGEISFASPLLETPQPLSSWKVADAAPGSAWAQPNYDDSKWKDFRLALAATADGQSRHAPHWYRAMIPAGRLKAGHAYALYLQHGAVSGDEVYVDGSQAASETGVQRSAGHAEQFDLPPGARQIAVKLNGNATPSPAYIVEVGTSPPNLNLTGNWQLMQHTINTGEDNSQILTISLSGLKQYEGFELDVCYQIHAGEEPTIAKWFSFVHHRKSNFLLETVTLDRWLLPEGWSKASSADGPIGTFAEGTASGATSSDVLLTAGLDAGSEVRADNHNAAPTISLYAALKAETPLRTAKSLTAFWHGNASVPAFLYQLYLGQYVARGTPASIPFAYNTRFAYRDQIDAATCETIIPIAAGLGLQAFILDDGWQTNRAADTGRYGDWLSDKNKFPQGLLPISTLVRVNKMRFGLWTDVTAVSPGSQAALLHPEWLYKPLPDEAEELPPMCFSGNWARQEAQSFLSLCREQAVTYLKVSFHPTANCMTTEHEHPTGHSLRAQQEAWAAFNDTLHGIDKSFVMLSAAGIGQPASFSAPENNDAWQEKEWLDPYTVPNTITNQKLTPAYWNALVNGLQPKSPEAEANNALFQQPSFTLCGQALCHVPMPTAKKGGEQLDYLPAQTPMTRDQLDYLWSSVAGRYSNYEVQGNLEQMTAEERETAHKWLDWSRQNREWLAFTQPLEMEMPAAKTQPKSAPSGKVRGILHLRNALHGRYGYVCLWNMDAAEATVTPAFDPADWFVRVKPGLQIINTADGKLVPYSTRGGTVVLGNITLPAYGWAIYEVKAK